MLSRDEIFPILLLDVPTAPTNLIRMKSTTNSITIRWGLPKETGNSPIISYLLEADSSANYRTAVNFTEMGKSQEYEYTFRFLKAKVKYNIRVYAFNKIGKGDQAMQIYEAVHYIRKG